jgi:hypothetical protein
MAIFAQGRGRTRPASQWDHDLHLPVFPHARISRDSIPSISTTVKQYHTRRDLPKRRGTRTMPRTRSTSIIHPMIPTSPFWNPESCPRHGGYWAWAFALPGWGFRSRSPSWCASCAGWWWVATGRLHLEVTASAPCDEQVHSLILLSLCLCFLLCFRDQFTDSLAQVLIQ